MTPGERTALLVGSLALVGVGGFVLVRNLKTKSSTTTTSPTSPKPTLAQKAAAAGWTQYQGGAYYTAGHGATLTALASIIGIPVATLVRYNCRSSATILLGAVIHTAQQTCPPSGSGGSGSSTSSTITLAHCATLGYHYSVRDVGSVLPCVKRIQARLNKLLGTHLVIDGRYGNNTYAAVVTFQANYHLDGVPGEIIGTFGSSSDWATLVNGYTTINGLPGSPPPS